MAETVFETERLKIGGFNEEDAEAYYRLLRSTRVNCFAAERKKSLEQVKNELRDAALLNDGSLLAVSLKETSELIGVLFGLWEGDTFSVCWIFDPEHQGRGYAFEAARAFFSFLFGPIRARRIYAYVEDYNSASRRLCEKLGMRLEGEFKEFVSFVNAPDGSPVYENTLQYAILKKEWPA